MVEYQQKKNNKFHPMQDMEAGTAAMDDRKSVTCTYNVHWKLKEQQHINHIHVHTFLVNLKLSHRNTSLIKATPASRHLQDAGRCTCTYQWYTHFTIKTEASLIMYVPMLACHRHPQSILTSRAVYSSTAYKYAHCIGYI